MRFKSYTVDSDGVHRDRTLKTEILNNVQSVFWAVQTSEGVIYALLDCGPKKLYVRMYIGGLSPPSMKLYQADSYTKLLEWAASSNAYRLYCDMI